MSDWLIQAVGFVGMVMCIGSFQCKNTRHLLFFQMTGNFIYVIQFILLGAYSGCAVLLFQVLSNLPLCLERPEKRAWSGLKWFFVAAIVIASALTWKDIFSIFPAAGAVASVLSSWSRNGKKIRLAKLLIVGPGWLIYDIYAWTVAGILAELFALTSTVVSIFRYGLNNLDRQN